MPPSTTSSDPFDLARFVWAQEVIYEHPVQELRSGRKRSHWMWFVFPQLAGLGHSATAVHYAIADLAEAQDFLAHPLLGARLEECARALLGVRGRTAHDILGSPDDLKLRSSMTLFAEVAGPDSVFQRVLERYYGGEADARTLALLASS